MLPDDDRGRCRESICPSPGHKIVLYDAEQANTRLKYVINCAHKKFCGQIFVLSKRLRGDSRIEARLRLSCIPEDCSFLARPLVSGNSYFASFSRHFLRYLAVLVGKLLLRKERRVS